MDNSLISMFSLGLLSEQTTATQLVSLNEKTEQYGLSLTPADATALMKTRTEALTATGRVEVGSATIGKLIDAFCESAYINQREYPAIMHELIDMFYYVKNETLNLISDDELIEFMRDSFEYRCMGSLELLKGRELEKLADNLRRGVHEYRNMDYEEISEEEPEDKEDEYDQ